MTATPAEAMTGPSRLAYRMAAGILLANAVLILINSLIEQGAIALANIVIDSGLAFWLWRFSRSARMWVVVRAILGGILAPILYFAIYSPFIASVMIVMQWGYSAALVLLLTGQSRTWRLVLATGLFGVFRLGLYVLILIFYFIALWVKGL